MHKVTDVSVLDNYELLLTFEGGEQRYFDAKPLFSMSVFKPLQNKGFFSLVKVEYDSIAWPGDIDYCPDTLYFESRPL